LALVARQADQLVVSRQHIDVVPGHPDALSAAEFLFPETVAGSKIDRYHSSAIAGRINSAPIDHRPSADICQGRDGADIARRSQVVGPQWPTGFDGECVDLTGRIRGHDAFTVDGRACPA